jgi:hypothetical protein
LGLSRDPDASIANGKVQHGFGGVGLDACDRHRYFACVGEFHGIADEIHQHLPETAGVASHPMRHIGIDRGDDFQSLFVG